MVLKIFSLIVFQSSFLLFEIFDIVSGEKYSFDAKL